MRYIDSGSRSQNEALGSWLQEHLSDVSKIAALRWQSGFFGAGVLGLFAPALTRLRGSVGTAHLLVGSNDGTTRRADVAALLACVGPSRDNLRVGVVNYENAYFHSKTVHITRDDGRATAYVGSANLTESGTGGLHVESGLLLDTSDGDDQSVLALIAAAVDQWFASEPPPGLYEVTCDQDLDDLVSRGVLDVPKPPRPRRPESNTTGRRGTGVRLSPLLKLPPPPVSATKGTATDSDESGGQEASPTPPLDSADHDGQMAATSTAARWQKALTNSDAQRKPTGNQRGSITLVGGMQRVDSQRYFRFDFFDSVSWDTETTRTGRVRESAVIPFMIEIGDRNLGQHDLVVTYASNREAGQNNYTSLLHLGSLADEFAHDNLQGHSLTLERNTSGEYALRIS